MKQMKRILPLLLALMMLLSLCACGSYRSSKSSGQAAVPAVEAGGSYNTAYYSDGVAEESAMMADYDGDYGFAAVPAAAASNTVSGSAPEEAPAENPDKIIYSSEVTVETTEFDATIGKVSGLVETYGGWIESSSVSGSNYYQKSRGTAATRDATYTLRIPSQRFQALMDNLSELGNIPYSHIYTENVTTQYYDAAAHLKAYQTQEARLLEMMELAESVEDVITIEDRLTELRYQIESLQSRLNNWDRRVSYSTVYLSVKEVREYTPETKVDPTYGEELAQALKDGLYNAGQFLKDLLVFLVEVLPVLIILIPVVWLIVWLLRKIFRKLKERREARRGAKCSGKGKKATAGTDSKEPVSTEASEKQQ